MIKNYLKVAWRNLVRNKTHTFINMAGLSVGLACSLMILLWVQNELDMDAFHKNGKNLYQVYEQQHFDNKITGQYYTPGVLAAELKRVIPEIQNAVGRRRPKRKSRPPAYAHGWRFAGRALRHQVGADAVAVADLHADPGDRPDRADPDRGAAGQQCRRNGQRHRRRQAPAARLDRQHSGLSRSQNFVFPVPSMRSLH